MANTNTTTKVVDTIFARSLQALRQYAVMPRYVYRGYDTTPGQKLSAITIPVPASISASAVTPSYVPPDDSGISPSSVTLTLNKWYETAFFVNDKELEEIVDGFFNAQLSEAIKGLANQVDGDVLALYKDIYGYAGVAGTTPFASGLDEAADVRKVLADQLAPTNDRYLVMDTSAEANAISLRAVQDASFRKMNPDDTLRTGEITDLLGFRWAVDQNISDHTAGAGFSSNTVSGTAGETSLTAGGNVTLAEGDIFTIADDSQSYVVNTAVSADTDISSISPALATSPSGAAATLIDDHTPNLAFQRGAFALAARPMAQGDPFGLNPLKRSIMDPVSGLSLTMEISRQHYRTRIAFSSLYGVQTIRRELAARMLG